MNCKEKWAKTQASRNAIPQVQLIRYGSPSIGLEINFWAVCFNIKHA